MSTAFDAIVVGAGHNGLVAANYLARAGQRVAVVERRHVVGGACVTEEIMPGFRASTCSYVAGLLRPEVIRELELERFGLRMYQTEVSNALIADDGRHVALWKELDRTLRALDALGPRDAEGFVQLGSRMQRFARLVGPYLLQPAPPLWELVRRFEQADEAKLFEEFMSLSISDLLDRYIDSDLLKGLFTFLAMVSVHCGPLSPGSAYVYGHHSWGEFDGRFGQYGFVRGGMGGISEALAAGARHFGATVRTEAPVAQIRVEGGRVAGVVVEGGEELSAPIVLSNADPYRTYTKLLSPDVLAADVRADVEQLDFRGTMARVFVALDGLPDFTGLPPGEGPHLRGLTLLGADVDRFEAAWDAQKRREIHDDPVIEFIVQTVHDPGLAPAGKHLLSTGIQQLPFEPAAGSWDELEPAFTKMVVDRLAHYAPDLPARIIDTRTITPLDLEREYALTGGNIFQGAMTLGQLFAARPLPGFDSYRTPIGGLYLCGSGTHPGGGVMGANGRNAARMVLSDEGRTPATVRRSHGPPLERVLAHPRARRAAVSLAKRRWTRPVARMVTRARRDG